MVTSRVSLWMGMIGSGSPAALGGFALEMDYATGVPRGSRAGAVVGQGIVAEASIPAGALPPALPAARVSPAMPAASATRAVVPSRWCRARGVSNRG